MENNTVTLIGEIVSGFTYNHEVYGEGFYLVDLAVKRLSDQMDVIPVLVSDRLFDVSRNYSGHTVQVVGQYRSFNIIKGNKKGLFLSVFAREIFFLRSDLVDATKSNSIYLKGYLCKIPDLRATPLGREITDMLIAVNRPYGKSDYIPCIVWGRNARYAAGFEVGSTVEITGRIQSREYKKRLDDERVETRVAYEVSVSKINLILG
ncbi:single-stranded DNA-binding protein [Lacrimispora sp.]|jgi:primosomal replication protein N|uniref:single-stranded DNA-binding protein n=1 Tax=Lacrimispora sp. TaxID=2719234 RepID=UPI0028AA1EB0|nr:single-stranded DNA-binding protein [Lacrimispora sp.]